MRQLLETKELRKLEILYALSSTISAVNIHELTKKLGINIKTLLLIVEEINEDAELFKQDVRVERESRSHLKLQASHNFSILYFRYRYFKNTMSYQILDSIFKGDSINLQKTAEKYYISKTSVYRKTLKIKKLLDVFELEMDNLSKFPIKGKEIQIRYFYYMFYWHSVQIFEWPFEEELRERCLKLYERLFSNQLKIKSIFLKEKVILWIAINISRTQEGYVLSWEEVKHMKEITSFNINYVKLKAKIDNYFLEESKSKKLKLNEFDYIFSYCMLVCDEDYCKNHDFYFINLHGERKLYKEITILFLNEWAKYLDRPLSNEEFYILYKGLLRIHLHAYFIIQKGMLDTSFYREEMDQVPYQDFYSFFDKFYQNFYNQYEDKYQLFKNNANLYQQYAVVLINSLDMKTFHPPIEIALIIIESHHIKEFYCKKIQSLTLSPVKFVNEFTKSVDLIISYIPLQLDLDYNNFVINIPATRGDWNRLQSELDRIQSTKRLKFMN